MNVDLVNLIKRKQKADAMPSDIREKYSGTYDAICEEMTSIIYNGYYEDEIDACLSFFKKHTPTALCGVLTGDGYYDFCEEYLQLKDSFKTKLASHFLCFIVAELDSINKCILNHEHTGESVGDVKNE